MEPDDELFVSQLDDSYNYNPYLLQSERDERLFLNDQIVVGGDTGQVITLLSRHLGSILFAPPPPHTQLSGRISFTPLSSRAFLLSNEHELYSNI